MILRFILFFLFFSSTFGGLHLYIYFKSRPAVSLVSGLRPWFIVFLVLMSLAPVLVRLFERTGPAVLARITAYTGYLWMGGLVFIVSLFFITDLYRWAGGLFHLVFRNTAPWPAVPQPMTVFIVAGISILGILYGLWEANSFIIERVTIPAPGLERTITIAQVSDIHLGQMVGRRKIETILDMVRKEKPDLFICTGDLVDEDMSGCGHLAEIFRQVQAPLGNFAVTGNHEMFAGLDQAAAFTESAGFTVLRNTHTVVAGNLVIAGVDDRAGVQMGYIKDLPPDGHVLENLKEKGFVLFLKHTPSLNPETEPLFDLMLSGHTHRGQILPFAAFTRLAFKYHAGLYRTRAGSHVYVNRGTGTWGPPIRVASPPEVTVITLQP